MASYFDEHGCNPLPRGEAPDDYLHFARLILHGGYWQGMQMEYSHLFGEKPPPPASKTFVNTLKTSKVTENAGQCAVCLKEWVKGDFNTLPCKHRFHPSCIIPWLEKTNSCPMCRHELPTDDEDYEEYKRQKKRQSDREAEIKMLHNSMFS
ncbi:hypothetical protein SK128_025825 [Halocaridina rubra]|uniref:E3 ubiquitin-protein ligase RNF181 n=1 Tax=Halocaridina rubra TaxID=373956 RepID=A0AAN9A413_HALRR